MPITIILTSLPRDTWDLSGSGSGSGSGAMPDDVTTFPTFSNSTSAPQDSHTFSMADFVSHKMFVFLGVLLVLAALAAGVCVLVRYCYGKRGTRVLRRIHAASVKVRGGSQKQTEKQEGEESTSPVEV